jgi:hypothetical protein
MIHLNTESQVGKGKNSKINNHYRAQEESNKRKRIKSEKEMYESKLAHLSSKHFYLNYT